MNVHYSEDFIVSFLERIQPHPKLVHQFRKKVNLFTTNPSSKQIKDHLLVGKHQGKRAFSITKDIRIIYKPISKIKIVFLDIGNHNQVYKEKTKSTQKPS